MRRWQNLICQRHRDQRHVGNFPPCDSVAKPNAKWLFTQIDEWQYTIELRPYFAEQFKEAASDTTRPRRIHLTQEI